MFRYKSNKQALIIAVLVILLCLVCLAGSTLALFTSNPEDGTIGIVTTAGDVEVDIVDTSKEENSLVGGVLQFHTSAERTEILFEPGACFYTQGFKVKNTGNIPINFRMSIAQNEVDDEEGKINTDMEEFKKAFEFFITQDPTNLDNAQPLEKVEGKLEAKQSTGVYYLVVRMKTTADNTFQDQRFAGVGITVYAVQGNAVLGD